jgi:hypothetical protein
MRILKYTDVIGTSYLYADICVVISAYMENMPKISAYVAIP